MKIHLLCPFLALFAASCSTTLVVKEVDPKKNEAIDGVPFRMAAPHKIHLYEWNKSKDGAGGFDYLNTFSLDFADTEKLFTVNFSAAALADPTFGLTIAEDGTIRKLTLDSQAKADEVLGGAAAGAIEIKNALLDAEKRELERIARAKADDKALVDAATTQENARLAAYQAFLAAETATAQYWELLENSAATHAARVAKRNEIASLRAKANALYRLAGMTPPYNDAIDD